MKSALKIVAFSNVTRSEGIIALLETALRALDDEKSYLSAACVSAALDHYYAKLAGQAGLPSAMTGSLH